MIGSKSARSVRAPIVAWVFAFTAQPAIAGTSAPDRPPAEERSDEARCEALARELEARLERRPDTPSDVARLEAEEIGRVADELLVEGDFELAATLFEEALALLPKDPDGR